MNPEETTENAEEIPCEDNTEALLEKYKNKSSQKTDDITAMQSVMCILIAAALFIMNFVNPELCESLYGKLHTFTDSEREIIPNLIDLLINR